jgi:hypothetical protein
MNKYFKHSIVANVLFIILIVCWIVQGDIAEYGIFLMFMFIPIHAINILADVIGDLTTLVNKEDKKKEDEN